MEQPAPGNSGSQVPGLFQDQACCPPVTRPHLSIPNVFSLPIKVVIVHCMLVFLGLYKYYTYHGKYLSDIQGVVGTVIPASESRTVLVHLHHHFVFQTN